MRQLQPRIGIQIDAAGAEVGKVRGEIGPDAGEISASLVHVPLHYEDRDVPFLNNPIAAGSLVDEHVIILVAQGVKPIFLMLQKQCLFKIRPVQRRLMW